MSNQRKKWSRFEEIFKQSDSNQAISILKDNYTVNNLIKFENKYGKGLLHMSVELNKPKIANYLINIGCNVDQINRQDGRSPLALALSLPHSEKMVSFLFQRWISYSWRHVTGHSKKLKFGNEKIAEIFREGVKDYLAIVLHDYDEDDQMLSCHTVEFLHKRGWPQEGLSFLRFSDQFMSFAQLYYASTEADVVKVKHCLDNEYYGHLALIMAMNKAVSCSDPKSIVVIKLLMDKNPPIYARAFREVVHDMLDVAFLQNDVDKALVLMQSGNVFEPRIDYFMNQEVYKKRFGKEYICLNVFVKPTIAFREFLDIVLRIKAYEDHVYDIIRFHARIESYEYPTDLTFYAAARALFVRCRSELDKMKATVVNENFNVRDIIDKPLNDIVAYTYNEELMNEIEAIDFDEEFPDFCDIIQERLEVARRIRDWTEQSKDFLADCIPAINSNCLILSKIVNYLGVPNLIVLSLE